ncbi:MAG: hypothetical protein JWQ87_2271 [Candidatus Sulfotelmatobacter sp.]|nr:hypothetical protein [Candidatus Sulfotelmatobacter sp.]
MMKLCIAVLALGMVMQGQSKPECIPFVPATKVYVWETKGGFGWIGWADEPEDKFKDACLSEGHQYSAEKHACLVTVWKCPRGSKQLLGHLTDAEFKQKKEGRRVCVAGWD